MKALKILVLLPLGFIAFASIWGKNSRMFFDQLKIEELDSLELGSWQVGELLEMAKYADAQVSNPKSHDDEFKSEVMLMVIADEVTIRCKNDVLERGQEDTDELLKLLENHKFLTCPKKVTDLTKLSHYACQGKFNYIYKRASSKWYFWTAIILAMAYLIVLVLVLANIIKWKRKRAFIMANIAGVSLMAIAILFFVLRCNLNA